MNREDVRKFNAGLEGWFAKTKVNWDAGVRAIAGRMAENIIRRTPVDTGFLRNNWYPSLNVKEDAPPAPVKQGDVWSIAKGDPTAAVLSLYATGKAGDIFYLQNGVPYAAFVEFGTARMAPRAMVATTMLEMEAFFAQYMQDGAV